MQLFVWFLALNTVLCMLSNEGASGSLDTSQQSVYALISSSTKCESSNAKFEHWKKSQAKQTRACLFCLWKKCHYATSFTLGALQLGRDSVCLLLPETSLLLYRSQQLCGLETSFYSKFGINFSERQMCQSIETIIHNKLYYPGKTPDTTLQKTLRFHF